MSNPILDEARRIAGQPRGDKLDGKQGQEAHAVIIRLLEEAGLDYADGLKLLGAFEWDRWKAGYRSAREDLNKEI
jgi:hypothetical protein